MAHLSGSQAAIPLCADPARASQEPRLWTVLWSTRWRNACRGGQPGVNCGWLVDGQRILKLVPETSCAVRPMGVEISSPPGTVTGEGETPSHPAKDNSWLSGKEESGATGAGETPRHPVSGGLRGLWSWGKSGATRQEGNPQGGTSGHRRRENFKVRGEGETPSHVRRRKLWASGAGKTSRCVAKGKPRVMCGEESSGPSAKGQLQIMWRRGNPELRNEKKALSHGEGKT